MFTKIESWILLALLTMNFESKAFTVTRSFSKMDNFKQIPGISGLNTNTLLTAWNGAVYFSANNSSGRSKLFKWDGITLSQPLGAVGTFGSATVSDSPEYMTVYNGSLYFSAQSSFSRTKLFKWDGTTLSQPLGTSGTSVSTSQSDNPARLTVYNGNLYFSSLNSSLKTKLYMWDETALTQPLGISGTSGASGNDDFQTNGIPTMPVVCNNILYFPALNSASSNIIKLYGWNGASLSSIGGVNGSSGSTTTTDDSKDLTILGTNLYISSISPNGVEKTYLWNGTSLSQPNFNSGDGTVNNSGANDSPRSYKVYNNAIYFKSRNSSYTDKFFKWDGTNLTEPLGPAGSSGASGSTDNPTGSNLTNIAVFNGSLYYTSNNSSAKTKLYKWNGTTLSQPLGLIGTSNSAGIDDDPINLISFNNMLLFIAKNSTGTLGLYYTRK